MHDPAKFILKNATILNTIIAFNLHAPIGTGILFEQNRKLVVGTLSRDKTLARKRGDLSGNQAGKYSAGSGNV